MGNAFISQISVRRKCQSTATEDVFSRVLDQEVLVALCNYPSADICDPIYRTGEKLRLLSEEGYWWKVSSILTKEENYIPHRLVAKIYHGWLFENVARDKAEELLCLPGNRVGSFLIRNNASGQYALSIKHRTVKHYRIHRLPNNWYFISPRLTFQCLEDLVNHYSECADGLCCILTAPCLGAQDSAPTERSPALPVNWTGSFSWSSVSSSDLLHEDVGSACPGNQNSVISYGVQSSLSSYMSLAGMKEDKGHSWRKRRGRSVYIMTAQQHNQRPAIEEDAYEDVV
ncbi:src-like-adapter [Denticeps clupeoides]|uniref:SH2 domain-containing protein n=1 Tax=Denticeps clupeoides TaxID=299321 RepID=A0AAY4CCQ5_9TELE|nr:src-like-adapter [Denticeps clupeoides]